MLARALHGGEERVVGAGHLFASSNLPLTFT